MMEDIGEIGCGDGNVFSVIVFNLDSGETLKGQWRAAKLVVFISL